jgi:hypothetical protein
MTQKSEFFDLLHVFLFLFLFVHRAVLSLLRIGTLSHCHCRQWAAFSRAELTPPTASQANGSTPNLSITNRGEDMADSSQWHD